MHQVPGVSRGILYDLVLSLVLFMQPIIIYEIFHFLVSFHSSRKKDVYMQIFMLVGVSVIEILLFNQEKNMATVKILITIITPGLQDFLPQISLDFNIFSTLMLVKVKLSGN